MLSSGTPTGWTWLASTGARSQPSVPRPLGASTSMRSPKVYRGSAAAQSSRVRPSGVAQSARSPLARPEHGSGPRVVGVAVAPHMTLPARSAAIEVGPPP